MRSIFGLIFFSLLITIPGHSHEIDYNQFNSPQEVIEFETDAISQIEPNNYQALSDAYISRGESYLFCGKYEAALEDLKKGSELAALYGQDQQLTLRSLLVLSIIYANCDMLEELNASCETMISLLKSSSCHLSKKMMKSVSHAKRDVPINGPREIPIQDCIENAEGTAKAAKLLIVRAKPEVQFFLNSVIDEMEKLAIECCLAGGLWKACLQPIINKWHQWNERWKVFGIPPDPSWD